MAEGIRAPDFPLKSSLSEFHGNLDSGLGMEGPVRVSAVSIAAQLTILSGTGFSTWLALSLTTGTTAGQLAEVFGDAGTHTDPVTAALVQNSGVYGWSVSPAGWKWLSAGDIVSLNAAIQTEAATRATADTGLQTQITALTGALVNDGSWNASTNTPTLSSGVGTSGHYRIVSVAGTTTLDGISSWAVGDWALFSGGTWKKITGQASSPVLAVGSSDFSYRFGVNYSTIDTTVTGSTVFDGTASFPNKLGVNNTKPVSDPSILVRVNDTGYVAGAADVAGILAGYDNVQNALAGIIASQHSMIYSTAEHAAIFGGSLHTVKALSAYASIFGGSENIIEENCNYGAIVGGLQNKLEAGGTFPDNYGHRGVIVGGLLNNVSGQWGLILSGQQNIVTGKFCTVFNGESCNVSGAHSIATGNGVTVSGTYSYGYGVTITVAGARVFAMGSNITAAYDYCIAFGDGAVPPTHGVSAWASRQRAAGAGRNQRIAFDCSNETTDAVTLRLSTYGSSNYPAIPENAVVLGKFRLTGVDSATGDVSQYTIECGIKRGAGSTTATTFTPVVTTHVNAITIVTAPTLNIVTSGNYRVQVVGVAGKTIYWEADFSGHQIVYV